MSAERFAGEEDAVGRLYRRERRCFRWALVSVGLSMGTWIAARAYVWLTLREIAGVMSKGGSDEEIWQLESGMRGWANVMVVVSLTAFTAFLISFVGWLVAIRKRRLALNNLPPRH